MRRARPWVSIGGVLAVAVFGGLMWLMLSGLDWNNTHSPNAVPSPLINKPAPAFNLPRLADPDSHLTKADMLGQPYLLNVFASWCYACGEEHPVLMAYASKMGVPLVGYDYKDAPTDATAWLDRHGNPYHMVVVDQSGLTAFDFGVYGAPETFLIDAKGVIRYKHIGPLTPKVIHDVLEPKVRALKTEARS